MSQDDLLRSLTPEQREAIAAIIESQDVEGDYCRDEDGDSVGGESASATLAALARRFRYYDPQSVLE